MKSKSDSKMAAMRKKALLTQEEAAAKLGVDRSSVAKWETGVANPRASMLLKLARLYDCTIEELLGAA